MCLDLDIRSRKDDTIEAEAGEPDQNCGPSLILEREAQAVGFGPQAR
jgi:hypothetical protein